MRQVAAGGNPAIPWKGILTVEKFRALLSVEKGLNKDRMCREGAGMPPAATASNHQAGRFGSEGISAPPEPDS